MRNLWLAHPDLLSQRPAGIDRTIYELRTRPCTMGHQITSVTWGWNGSKSLGNFQGLEIRRSGTNISPHLGIPVFIKDKKGLFFIQVKYSNNQKYVVFLLSTIAMINRDLAQR